MNLVQRDQAFVWHPFTPQKNYLPPIPIVHAKGSLLYDEDGKSYIDAISSWWVNLHGHAHPFIAQRIYEQALQLEQVIFAGFTHRPAVELAEKLLQVLPEGFSKIFYSDNGSTATEVALKMALQYWWNKKELPNRKKIFAFKNAYHGDTFGAMSMSARSVFTRAFQDLFFEVLFIDTPTEENIEAIFATIEEHGHSIAAFIFEPLVQGAGGMNMYAAKHLDAIIRKVRQYDIITIADEVMTGFFRTGKFFACMHLQESPDILCMSKGLTGGTMALGATACVAKIHDAYISDDPLHTFFHGHSFTANPLACTAALASMELLRDPACLHRIEQLCMAVQDLAIRLQESQSNFSIPVKNIRYTGTILAFEITEGANNYLHAAGSQITQKALQTGIYLRPLGNTVYLMPPYCFQKNEWEKVEAFIFQLLS